MYLGKGVGYPILPDSQGMTRVVDEDDRIASNIRFLLSVRKKSVPGLEDLGSSLPDIEFERIAEDVAYLKQELVDLFRNYEKRITVIDLLVEVKDGGKGLRIRMLYKIKGSDDNLQMELDEA